MLLLERLDGGVLEAGLACNARKTLPLLNHVDIGHLAASIGRKAPVLKIGLT